jgi:two-component system, cell cycle sensor histidine kinase and response regulator CckA
MREHTTEDRRLTQLGLVAAVVAHDFNNVLSIMRACTGMLRILPGLTTAQSRELDDLNGAVRHGAELVQQVYAAVRNAAPAGGAVDLNKVIAQMSWMLRRLGRKNIGVDLVLGRDIGFVRAEEVQVEQMLINLAINARDAMPEGGRLLIETGDVPRDAECSPPLPHSEGGYVRLIVSDTGAGLEPDVQARLFEPFFTTKPAGIGLGLFSVRRIAERCGAELRVRSAAGMGTTFEIYFPRADPSSGAAPL